MGSSKSSIFLPLMLLVAFQLLEQVCCLKNYSKGIASIFRKSEAVKDDQDLLVITKVYSNENCLSKGQPFIVKTSFKYNTRKIWAVKLNDTAIEDLRNVVFDRGLNATIRIGSELYGRQGNSTLEIMISNSDKVEQVTLSRQFCVSYQTGKVEVSVTTAVAREAIVVFYIESENPSNAYRRFSIGFGDGSYDSRQPLVSPLDTIDMVYFYKGSYEYDWRIYENSAITAIGSGTIKVINAVKDCYNFRFSRAFEKDWPQNNVQFWMRNLCYYFEGPDETTYRINFGDGETTPWLTMPPLLCSRYTYLVRHTYRQPGCYDTWMEMKNPLGWCRYTGFVYIQQAISSLALEVENVPPAKKLEKEIQGIMVTYLRKRDPFQVKAVTTGGRCRTYKWEVVSPYWHRTRYEVDKTTISHLAGVAGTFDLDVTVSNRISSLRKRQRIILIDSIAELSLLVSDPKQRGNVDFYVLVKEHGKNAQFIWDFGNSETATEKDPSFTPARDLLNIKQARGSENLDLESYVGFMKSYTYSTDGTYVVNVTGVDSLVALESSRTVHISKKACRRPIVKILKERQKTHFVFFFRESFTILTNVTIECDDSNEAVFHWSIFKSSKDDLNNNRLAESDKATNFPAGVVTNQREITIQKRTVSPEIYKVKLEVSMKSLGYAESDETFLEISPEPLHVRIEGGSTRLLSWQEKAFFDGSFSYDPNILQGNTKNLIYKWHCKVKPGSLYFVIGAGGCFGHGHDLVEHHESTWTISEKAFIRNAVYIVKLVVESRTSPGRSGFFEQYVDIQAGTFMKTRIQCETNCQDRLDPQTRLSLTGSCENCGNFVNYKWELLDKGTFKAVPVQWLKETRTPQNSISLVLLPGILKPAKEYLARFTATTPTGEQGYNDYGIALSTQPYGGNCSVSPSVGEAVKTQFVISCHGWRTSSVALKYSMSLIKNSAVVGALKDDSESTLLSYGPLPHTTTKLPEGPKDRDYIQHLDVRIIDSYGASVVVNLTLKVLPFATGQDLDVETPLESELETYVHGKESTMAILSGSGDLQGLSRFTQSIGKSLDTAKTESDTSGEPDTLKEKRRKKREKMRESIVDSLTGFKVTTLDNFGLISSALEKVSVSADELSKSSQDKLLHFYELSGKFMDESYLQWKDRDPKEIQDAYGGFLEGVANVMSSAVIKRSNGATQEKEKADYLKFTEDALRIIENSTSILFRSMVANEIAKRITSGSISVEMKRSEEDRLGRFQIETLGGGRLKTPSRNGVLGVNETKRDVIDMKMVSLSRNPFTWDNGSIGQVLSPSISSVKYIVNGVDVPVANLAAGDELILEIPTPNITLVNRTASVKPGELQFISMNLSAVGLTVMLKTRCAKNDCQVFVRYDGIPTPTTYFDAFNLSKDIGDNNFRRYSKVNFTTFHLAVFTPSGNFSNVSANEPTIFKMQAYTTGCFYWKEEEEMWSSEGCKISEETNPSKTICLCNHLTWFGAGIMVQPTIIDPRREIMKIKQLDEYPALLAAVCVIGGFYLLAMVWARSKDRKDVLKASLTIVDTCCQTHKYRYDVTIYTGSRPGAGTSSCVCMILGGSKGETDPYCLSYHSNVLFQRGNVDSFLVTSAEDIGEIKWIRIWHDNTGKSASWFLSRITVTDIVREREATFICHAWLGIGIEDGQIDKVFLAVDEKESKNFATLFLTKTARGFSDDHLWFSIAMRPSRSHFTRCQRVSCCLATLLCTMLANAMFYQKTAKVGTEIKIGSFSFSWHQIAIGVESALIVIPINLLIVNVFRKAAPLVSYASDVEINGEDEAEEDYLRREGHTSVRSVHKDSEGGKEEGDIEETEGPCIEAMGCKSSSPKKDSLDDTLETVSHPQNYEKQEVNGPSAVVSNNTMDIIDLLGLFENDGSNKANADGFLGIATEKQYKNKDPLKTNSHQVDKGLRRPKNSKSNAHSLDLRYLEAKRECSPGRQRSKGTSRYKADISKITRHSYASPKSKRGGPDNVTRLPRKPHSPSKMLRNATSSAAGQTNPSTSKGQERQNVTSNVATFEHVKTEGVNQENIVITIESTESYDGTAIATGLSNSGQDLCGFLNSAQGETLEIVPEKHHHVHLGISKHVIRDILCREKSSDIKVQPRKQNEAAFQLPHWCLYFGWTICFATAFVAGFFTLLYGLSFGRAVQEEWLVSLLTSIFQDIFISQPTKVIVLGCIFAFIVKKLSVDEQLPETKLARNENWIRQNLPLQDKKAVGSKVKIPLQTDSYVRKAQEKQLKDTALSKITVEVVVYFFYIFLAMLITYGHRSPNAYVMGANVKSMLITNKFNQIKNVNEFWEWMSKHFLPCVYEENWYNGEATGLSGYLDDYVTYLIGRPRIRQLRVVQGDCPISSFKIPGGGTKVCEGTFDTSSEDKTDYFKGWNTTGPVPDSLTTSDSRENPWRYSRSNFPGNFLVSKISMFQTGGYLRTLDQTLAAANATIQYLKENLWIDTRTRILFVEFSTYNNNDNFYCIVSLALSFSPTGGVASHPSVITTKLDRYNTQFSFFLAACEISFLLFTLYYMQKEVKIFHRKGFAYIKEYGTLVELLAFCVTWASFGLFIIRHGVVRWTKNDYKDNPNAYTSFQQAAYIDIAYGYALAAVVVIAYLKVLKLLRFNNSMLLLTMTLRKAGSGIKNYFLLFGIAVGAFTQWAHLSFGQELADYATFLDSFMTILNLLLGAPQLQKLVQTDRIFGPIFSILFVFLISFVIMNLFLAMLMDAFSEVRKELRNQPNYFDILAMLHSRFANAFPFLRKIIKIDSQLSGIDQYYENRLQQRKGDTITDFGPLMAKIDKLERSVQNVISSELDELKEFAFIACKFEMKKK